eukprot:2034302-Prymnesium_polylepis.2
MGRVRARVATPRLLGCFCPRARRSHGSLPLDMKLQSDDSVTRTHIEREDGMSRAPRLYFRFVSRVVCDV